MKCWSILKLQRQYSRLTYFEHAGVAVFAVLGAGGLPLLLAFIAALKGCSVHVVWNLDVFWDQARVSNASSHVENDYNEAQAVKQCEMYDAPKSELNLLERSLGGVGLLEPVEDAEYVSCVVSKANDGVGSEDGKDSIRVHVSKHSQLL